MSEADQSDTHTWGFAANVAVGDSVTWTNMGAQTHTVTASDGSFDSMDIPAGEAGTIEFDTPGIFAYTCSYHPTMIGYVSVSDTPTTPTPMAIVEPNPAVKSTWGYAVSVQVGQSIAWTNIGSEAHTATSTATSNKFDTGLVAPGDTAPVEFDKPGTFPYICTPHPWMKGIVVVS